MMKRRLTACLLLAVSMEAAVAQTWEQLDRQESNKNFRAQVAEEKKNEAQARYEWKAMSQAEKDASPWETWYRKKLVPALLKLSKIRKDLYRYNLFDSYLTRPENPNLSCDGYDRTNRRLDGTCNDFNDKMAGSAWTRFARNIDLNASYTDEKNLLIPNPREVSLELLTRDTFKPVPFLNLLAVGWIQYMTHDWFSHGENASDEAVFIPLNSNDPLLAEGMKEMILPLTRHDETRTALDNKKLPRTYLNEGTHWWDGSQLYGSDKKASDPLRTFKGGKLIVTDKGVIPTTMMGMEMAGFDRNWWLGLSLMHNLFTLEHNAIADKLAKSYPTWTDQQIYDKARLINAALMAKIHTIEWTPAILPNRTLRTAMNANWKGLVNRTEKVEPWFELFNHEVLFGVVGGKLDTAGKPFHMTEEFVSVYRMHSLLPDEIQLKQLSDGSNTELVTLGDTREAKSAALVNKHGLTNLLYSFGKAHPGALVLNNFPKTLQKIEIPFGGLVDMGAVDVFRDRERGVPRYNEFRRQFQLKEVKSFEDLTDDKEVVAKLKKIYGNDIEKLDLLVGCLAEKFRPTGYGFGETAFQVFIVMASRRLAADRFYTKDYNARTYTPEGIKWIDDNGFKSVVLRHFPELKPALFGVKNAFNPWNSVK